MTAGWVVVPSAQLGEAMGGFGHSRGQDDGWWEGSDGTRYPPSAARHPAARAGQQPTPTGDGVPPGRHPTWRVKTALLVPIVAAGLVLLVGLSREPGPGRTEATDVSPPPYAGGAGDPGAGERTGSSTSGSGSTASESPPAASPPPRDTSAPSPPGSPSTSSSDPTPPASAPTTTPAPTSPPASTPSPEVPTDADQCKHGGWAHLVDDQGRPFTNQGDCVSFVQHQD